LRTRRTGLALSHVLDIETPTVRRIGARASGALAVAEITAIRFRAAAAGLKPTAYIRRCALAEEQPPIDRAELSRSLAALSHDLDDVRRTAG